MDFDRERKKRLQKYIKEVERVFEKMISEASSIVLKVKLTEELFKFKKNPKIIKDIDRILQQYNDDLVNIINTGTATEWQFANEKINHLKTLQLQRIASKIPQTILVKELEKLSRSPRNTEALKSFQQRKINDFTISDRTWSITEQMRNELEFAIDVSLVEGKSANQLAREIKKHLNEPDRLYRRLRDKHGNLVLSKNAQNFHPGQGVYRSSHKNALRLAKEEINTAYRESEQLRLMQNNDIVGVEIHLSPSHKIYDICDELKGKYPKDFKWSKWHIGCMCHRRVIMKTDEEFIRELKNGENLPPETSENFISQPPKHFTKWVEDNEERFKNWKRKPSFLEENKGYVGNGLSERYNSVNFETIYKGSKGGLVEKFTSGKQNKWELSKNENALKILADNGGRYKLLPLFSDGNKNPDAFNILTKKYVDIKVSDGVNGKNIAQSGMKEAGKQGANELIIHLSQKPDSYRKLYEGIRLQIKQNRCKSVKDITVIFPNDEVKIYHREQIKRKIKKE